MTSKEAFEKLGYIQNIVNNLNNPYSSGIQYIKKAEDSEMQRIGMISTKYIEFYFAHKEIIIYSVTEYKDGNISKGDAGILSFEEFNAIQNQVAELEWQI